MKLYKFKKVQKLKISKSLAWDFFSNPNNLAEITPKELGFKVIYPIEERMHTGQIIAYKIKPLLGFPITWVTEITNVGNQSSFIDEQRFGPYKFWHHRHIFKDVKDGVEMTDIVHYAIPLGFIGRILNSLIIRKKLNYIFDFRFQILQEKFGK
jgi:ligand-binding SRPBCC domain-containing protein